MKKLFIGKLSFSTSEATLRSAFADYEPLKSVRVITDKFSGKSRGFAFIEIENDDAALQAIEALDGSELDGRTISVNEARPQEQSSGFGSGNSRGQGSYRSGQNNNYRSSNNSRY